MTVTAKVVGGERLRAKVRALTGKSASAIRKANQKNADEFQALVRQAVPQDPKGRSPHLVDTVVQAKVGEDGVSVSIGTPTTPYPLHLEVGHRARDGSHVPGKAFWFPAKQVVKKRSHSRIIRAERAAIKEIAAGG